MTSPSQPGGFAQLAAQPVARIVAYYLIMAVALIGLHQVAPDLPGVFNSGRFDQLAASAGSLTGPAGTAITVTPVEAARETLIAMLGAFLLMLPVAWVYIYTRQTRGFQQSLVQTLIILSIVVAAVVVMVKSSVALAFSLGGIVGAVAFRNRLEDTKDAVHVFVAIGVGVAAGYQVMSVALVLSLFYNTINLWLWWTDFGRAPAPLEGAPARRRLGQLHAAKAGAGGAFVSQVDSVLLRSMSPEQLSALAQRAKKQQARLADAINLAVADEAPRSKFDGTLRVVVATLQVDATKRAIETALTDQVKRWQFQAAKPAAAGQTAVTYQVRFRKGVPRPLALESVRRGGAGKADTVEFV